MNYSIKKLILLRAELIRIVGFLLFVLVTINVLVYNTTARLSYLNKVQDSNDMLVSQIGISYEAMLSYMADTVNKISVFDFNNIDLNDMERSAFDFHTSVTKELTSVVTINSYIHSAYIYIPDLNKVYNSMYSYPRLTALESFFDNEIFLGNNPRFTTFMEPRQILDAPMAKPPVYKTVISITSPIAIKNISQTPYLVLNIDAYKLYSTILKNTNMSEDVILFAFNQNDTIVVHSGDAEKVTAKLAPGERDFENVSELQRLFSNSRPLISEYHSNYLNWTFMLISPANLKSNHLSVFVSVSVTSVLIVMFVITLFIINKTKPVNKAVTAMRELLWKDIIKDNISIDDYIVQQLRDISFSTESGRYGIIAICLQGEPHIIQEDARQASIDIEAALLNSGCQYKITQTEKGIITVVINYKSNGGQPSQNETAQKIFKSLTFNGQVFISLSSVQKNFAFLPLCYKECMDALNYKICLNSNILDYADIREGGTGYEYPSELVRQLVNNVTVGNGDFCAAQIEKMFVPFDQKRIIVEDTQFLNFVISLQNSVLKTVSALPVPVKVDAEPGVTDKYSLEKIKAELIRFTVKICNEINALDEDQNYKLFSAILDYIDKNCFNDFISLTQAADDLSINKNYLSRIVKEITGSTFNELINKKRIERSKELLKLKNKTIEEISSDVGFNYSYYFIKIFKSLEGLTPGQYRSGLANSTNESISVLPPGEAEITGINFE